MSITSGELYFRAHEVGKNTPSLADFYSFLHRDVDQEYLQQEHTATRAFLQKCRHHMRKKTEASLRSTVELTELLKKRRNRALEDAMTNEEMFRKRAKEFISVADERLMNIVLMYASVISNELSAQDLNCKEELHAIEAIKRQAIIAHELKVFAKYLHLETKGFMDVIFLDRDNEQYKRCKKAIKDNINSKLLRDGNFQGVRVLNICSLKNSRLAKFLHTAVKDDEGGKVKGLFCAVPRKSIYSLCVRGLHKKKDDSLNRYTDDSNSTNSPTKANSQNHNPSRRGSRIPVSVSNNARKMFEWSWFCYPPPDPPNTPSATAKSSKKASDAATSSSHSMHVRGVGSAMHVANESPPLQNDPQHSMRFTRSSTPHELFSEAGISDEGCFIALCRVLVSRIFKVEDVITPSAFLEASRHGYDTIYSEKRDEYVFLKPNHVLPEFLMHVQVVKQQGYTKTLNPGVLESSTRYISLPKLNESNSQLDSTNGRNGIDSWVSQLDEALSCADGTSPAVVQSEYGQLSQNLQSKTDEVIDNLKKNTCSNSDDMQKALQLSMQHKQTLFAAVQKTVNDCVSEMKSSFMEECKNIA